MTSEIKILLVAFAIVGLLLIYGSLFMPCVRALAVWSSRAAEPLLWAYIGFSMFIALTLFILLSLPLYLLCKFIEFSVTERTGNEP